MAAALPIISAGATLVGGAISARAANQSAQAQAQADMFTARANQQAGEIQAQQLEQQANYDLASAQQESFKRADATRDAIGRARAHMAASGLNIDEPIVQDIKSFGNQGAAAAISEGRAAQQAGRYQAAGVRYTGRAGIQGAQISGAARTAAARTQSTAQFINTIGTMANRFSSGPSFGVGQNPYSRYS